MLMCKKAFFLMVFAPVASASVAVGTLADWRLDDDTFRTTFKLPTAADRIEVLAAWNPLARDARIRFEEIEHQYFVDGNLVPKSVTGLVHQYEEGFSADIVLENMRPERRNR